MAGSSLFGIGSSGLQAFQQSLTTIGHNIANASTDGYSKQTVELASRPPQVSGYGFAGTGVQTMSISRSYDAYVQTSLQNTTSSASEFATFHALAAQIDNVLADPDTGVSASLQNFFNAMQDVADSPSSLNVREVLLQTGQHLSEQFNQLASWLDTVRGQVNTDIKNSVNEINQITDNIAKLNQSIVLERGRSGGLQPNDLLDQRDKLIRDLSGLISVNIIQQDDGAVNVMTGKGQVLVLGNSASTLEVYTEGGDPDQIGIAIQGRSGPAVPITNLVSGGRLGGLFGFRDRMLDPVSNSLGLVAIGTSNYINEQQNRGMDLDGALGADFFALPQPQTLTLSGTQDNVTVTLDDVARVNNSDYTLSFNTGAWQLTRKDTGQSVAMTGSGTAADPFIADGLSIEIASAPANGDTYLIRPTRNGARDMQMSLVNVRQIAAAAPLRSNTALTNTGTGVISEGTVTDINNTVFQSSAGQLSPPALIRFTSTTSYDLYDNSNPAAPVLLEAGIAYDPAVGSDVFPTPGGLDHGYSLHISGAPLAGDEFSTEYNTGGVGDNRNALLMAAVSGKPLLDNGSLSITDSYNALVADVGTDTKQAELNTNAQYSMLEQITATRESISGVNLDEEAANLLRFQQAYQAAAQVITVANTLFDTLLNAVRR